MTTRLLVGLCCLLFFSSSTLAGRATQFYVAPNGNDADPGTRDKPFASLQHAQETVFPGDTVWIRGGTYKLREDQIAKKERIWAYVHYLNKSGEEGKPIRYIAVDGERPIFDFSAVKPALRIDAFHIAGDWIHIKGLEVVGVQVVLKTHTQSIAFHNEASHNIFEQLVIHDGQSIGIYSVKGGHNLFLNCDAFNNHDYTSEDGKGGNVDGFGCHPTKGSIGNVFRGCRAWFNSDDGFDCINSHESVTFENCWAFYNGFSSKFERLADGNGFKAGGYGSTPADRCPNPPPRHVVQFCLAVRNRSSGFYSNHHLGGSDWFNNTAWKNGTNFNMLCRLPDNKTDIDGVGHKLRNNVAYGSKTEITRMDAGKCDSLNNSFDLGLKLEGKDFAGLDEADLIKPRQPNGDLPKVSLLHPSEGSQLKTKSKVVLGAFE